MTINIYKISLRGTGTKHSLFVNNKFFIILLSATPLTATTFSYALEYCKSEDNNFNVNNNNPIYS